MDAAEAMEQALARARAYGMEDCPVVRCEQAYMEFPVHRREVPGPVADRLVWKVEMTDGIRAIKVVFDAASGALLDEQRAE